MNDRHLLDRFVFHADQAAFAVLARRHAAVVYSSAYRRLRNADLAQDATQIVFIALARQSKTIRRDAVLVAWLLRATRFAALNLAKAERRRQLHERAAAEQKGRQMSSRSIGPADQTPDWERISPLLDDALDRLGESARSAVTLRWMEDRSYREIGEQLRISEAAAKQKVFRALGRIRKYLTRRGVVMPATALAQAIIANAVQAAPPAAIEAAVLAGTPSAVATSAVAGPALTQTLSLLARRSARQLVAGGGASLLLVATVTTIVGVVLSEPASRTIVTLPTASTVQAAGSAPASAVSTLLTGVVLSPDGRAISDASVLVSRRSTPVAYRGVPDRTAVRTDADGRFALSPPPEAYRLIVWHETEGFADLSPDQLAGDAGHRIRLKPWTGLTGTAFEKQAPAPGATIVFSLRAAWEDGTPVVSCELETRAGADGRFAFPGLPTGDGWVARRLKPAGSRTVLLQQTLVTTQVRRPASVTIGGAAGSRSIVGRMVDPAARAGDHARRTWLLSLTRVLGPNDPAYHGMVCRTDVIVSPDGSFVINDVPAGRYTLGGMATCTVPGKRSVGTMVNRTIDVTGEGGPDRPMEVGAIPVAFPPAADTDRAATRPVSVGKSS